MDPRVACGARVDEAEGSLPQGRANLRQRRRENRQVSGSPLGEPPPISFPPRGYPALPRTNTAQATTPAKPRGVARQPGATTDAG